MEAGKERERVRVSAWGGSLNVKRDNKTWHHMPFYLFFTRIKKLFT